MKNFTLAIVCLLCFPIDPVLSHGGNSDCSEECKSMYCPPEAQKKKKNIVE